MSGERPAKALSQLYIKPKYMRCPSKKKDYPEIKMIAPI